MIIHTINVIIEMLWTDKDKNTANAIYYFLNGSFAALSFLYHTYNLSEYGRASYLGCVQDK